MDQVTPQGEEFFSFSCVARGAILSKGPLYDPNHELYSIFYFILPDLSN
jgi:hypothetical protein